MDYMRYYKILLMFILEKQYLGPLNMGLEPYIGRMMLDVGAGLEKLEEEDTLLMI